MINQKLIFARAYEKAVSPTISKESRPVFHLTPWVGWMNDPNGFSYGWTKIEGIIVNIIPSDVSIADVEASRPGTIAVYPNPATDVLRLKNLPCGVADYAIFNAMGQRVKSGSTTGTISVAELQTGVYLLRIQSGKHLETARFVMKAKD